MERWSIDVADEAGTARVAAALAGVLAAGDTVLLEGELGAGKTTFVRSVARALGLPEDEPVTSPTFALVHEYECRLPLVHADLYRLSDPDELLELGLEDALGSTAVALVEWGERFSDAIPGVALVVRIEATGESSRRVTFEARGDRGRALLTALEHTLARA